MYYYGMFSSMVAAVVFSNFYKQANVCCIKVLPSVGLYAYAQISRVGK